MTERCALHRERHAARRGGAVPFRAALAGFERRRKRGRAVSYTHLDVYKRQDSGLVSCCISPPSSFPVFYSTRAPSSGQVSRACKTHSASEGRADGGVRMFHVKHSRSDAGGPRRGRHRDLLGHHSAPAFLLCSGASFGRWRASPRVRDALLTVRFPCAAAACSSARPRPYWKGSRSDKEQAWKA